MARYLLVPLVVLPALVACGGGGPPDPAIDRLPTLTPTVAEVRSLFDMRADTPIDVEGEEWTNAMVAQYSGVSLNTLEARRITGHRRTYYLGGRDNNQVDRWSPITVTVLIDLFQDEATATTTLEGIRQGALLYPIVIHGLGDEAVALGSDTWTAPSGLAPKCPCDFQFRVGRFLGSVAISHTGPPSNEGTDKVDPLRIALARLTVERMREAIDQS
jgi:hypothetical protein